MANQEQMGGVDSELKKAINDEGFEGDEHGGAAVIIGKKGVEINSLKEKVENEGKCADAATYVRLNKVVAVPVEDIPVGYAMPKKGTAWIGSDQCTFIDSQGNIATLIIDYSKIASIPQDHWGKSWMQNRDKFVAELTPLGFSFDKNGFNGQAYQTAIAPLLAKRQQVLELEAKDRKIAEFDF